MNVSRRHGKSFVSIEDSSKRASRKGARLSNLVDLILPCNIEHLGTSFWIGMGGIYTLGSIGMIGARKTHLKILHFGDEQID